MKTAKLRKLIRKSRLDSILKRQEQRRSDSSRLQELRRAYSIAMKNKL